MTPSARLLAVLLLASACGPSKVDPPGALVASDKARLTHAASDADLALTVAGNTQFAIDLSRELGKASGNVVFSPSSITTALAMTYAGTAGTTATAFENVMHIALPAERFHHAMNDVDTALRSRGVGAKSTSGRPFRLDLNNQLFSAKGMALLPTFLDTMAVNYGAGVRQLDFTNPEVARSAVNGWVKTNSENLIPELLAPDSLDSTTRLVLVNTIFFNAAWQTKFEKQQTAEANFTTLDGSTKRVPMMAGDFDGAQASLPGFTVYELPYDGNETSLVLLVPDAASGFAAFERDFTASKLSAAISALEQKHLALRLPKFEVRTPSAVGAALRTLGLSVAFSNEANFEKLSAEKGLAIADVVHEAVMKTDEDGTEAAAATAVVINTRAAPQFDVVDRPFIFVLRDRGTGSVLFMGRITDPS